MCNVCDVERGKNDLLMCHDVEVAINNRKIDDGSLNVSIGRDRDGKYNLLFDYYIDRNIRAASIDMPIQFCPFCGKEVQHEEPKLYPWDQEKRG